MEEDPEMAWARRVSEGLVGAQSRALANQFILMEAVRLLARSSDDPHKLLASLFEAVSARMDQGPIEDESRPVTAEIRDTIARFFASAGHGLHRPPDR